MRIAILTDIHGNREAFDAVLDAARRDSVDRFVLLGDLVGYGPDPEYIVEQSARLAEDGAVVIKGNHDEAVSLTKLSMSENARVAMLWTQPRMGRAHRDFLESLPMSHREGERLFVHASASQPAKWTYVNSAAAAAASLGATDAQHTYCGHTHLPAHFHALPGRAPAVFVPIANVAVPLSSIRRSVTVIGAVGQPRDGNAAACYGLLDVKEKTVTMRRIPYAADETLRKIKDYGLPAWLGMRLLVGR
jgi:predicted phosphodiesterase